MTTPRITLTADGILGYTKSLAALVAVVLGALAEFLPDDWTKPAQGVLAVCAVLAVFRFPNRVKPLGELGFGVAGDAVPVVIDDVPPGEINAEVDEPGKHAAPEE